MNVQIFVFISLFSFCSAWERYFVNENQDKLTHFYIQKNQLRCNLYGDRNTIQQILSRVSKNDVVKLQSITKVLDACAEIEANFKPDARDYYYSSKSIIFPGTKWCGSGHVAQSYDDLGKFWQADMCCRDHDHCPDTIPTGETKYGLTNNQIGSLSHCDCDDVFQACLKSHNNPVANKVGKMFFDALGQKCFKLEYPIVSCLKWAGIGDSQCQEYELDYSQEKKWQIFDAKMYSTK